MWGGRRHEKGGICERIEMIYTRRKVKETRRRQEVVKMEEGMSRR